LPTGRLNNIGCLESHPGEHYRQIFQENDLDGSEDDILWEDDGEDKDDSDWVTDNDSVMSDDGEFSE
jgi:hypothetical protein